MSASQSHFPVMWKEEEFLNFYYTCLLLSLLIYILIIWLPLLTSKATKTKYYTMMNEMRYWVDVGFFSIHNAWSAYRPEGASWVHNPPSRRKAKLGQEQEFFSCSAFGFHKGLHYLRVWITDCLGSSSTPWKTHLHSAILI